jgi:hypothetical protein
LAPTAYLDVDGHLVTKENGSVEPNALRGWVDEAREVTYAASRGRVADQQIGQVLAFSSKGPDGAWPDIAVRDLIEDLGAEDVENGIEIGVRNKRGVFSKSPNEGSKQEWQLANTRVMPTRSPIVGRRQPQCCKGSPIFMLRRPVERT